MPTKISDPTV